MFENIFTIVQCATSEPANFRQIYLNKIKGKNWIFTFSLRLQNMGLRQELDRLKNENMLLRDKLSKYTDV